MAVSHTALGTSLMRTVHTRRDPNPLINDPWGEQLGPNLAIQGNPPGGKKGRRRA